MDEEQKAREELAKKAMVSIYIGFQEMMRKQHYRQCQNGTLKAIIETTKIEFNLPDMQVTELAIQARVKRMRRKENKKNCAVHTTSTVIVTPEKPQRIKEMPDFIDPKLEAEHTFDMVVSRLQFFDEWQYYLVEGEVLYFPPGIDHSNGTRGSNIFDEGELRQFLEHKYGWNEPETVLNRLDNCYKCIQSLQFVNAANSPVNKISSWMKGLVESNGKRGSQEMPPCILHICGSPGTGKTMTVRWCFEQAVNDLGSEKRLVVSYINASSLLHKSKKEAMEATLGQLGISRVGQLDRTSRTSGRNIVGQGVVILLIDEIDFLVSVSSSVGATGAKQTGLEKYLSWLFRLALNENFRLGLICTSNSICNDKASRLNALGMPLEKLVFSTYSKEVLVLIVESRIGCTVVDPKVVAYVASKVSATSGDARKCLSLVAKAIELCREKGPPAFLESIVLGPVVKMPHAMMAIRESNIRITDVIDALPAYQKYLLVVGVHLSRECRKTKPIQFGELKKRALAAFGFLPNLDSVITLEDFRGIMEKLVDAGLLKVDGFDYSTPIGVLLTREVHFDLQLEDVESALEQTVLQEPFYKGMLHRLNSKPQHDR